MNPKEVFHNTAYLVQLPYIAGHSLSEKTVIVSTSIFEIFNYFVSLFFLKSSQILFHDHLYSIYKGTELLPQTLISILLIFETRNSRLDLIVAVLNINGLLPS